MSFVWKSPTQPPAVGTDVLVLLNNTKVALGYRDTKCEAWILYEPVDDGTVFVPNSRVIGWVDRPIISITPPPVTTPVTSENDTAVSLDPKKLEGRLQQLFYRLLDGEVPLGALDRVFVRGVDAQIGTGPRPTGGNPEIWDLAGEFATRLLNAAT